MRSTTSDIFLKKKKLKRGNYQKKKIWYKHISSSEWDCPSSQPVNERDPYKDMLFQKFTTLNRENIGHIQDLKS